MKLERVKRFIQLIGDTSFWESKEGERLVYQIGEIHNQPLAEFEKVKQISELLSFSFRMFDFKGEESAPQSKHIFSEFISKDYAPNQLSETNFVLIITLDLFLVTALKVEKETLVNEKDGQQINYVKQRFDRRKKDLLRIVESSQLEEEMKVAVKDVLYLNFLEIEITSYSNLSVIQKIWLTQQQEISKNTSFKFRDIAFEKWLPKSFEELSNQEKWISNWLKHESLLNNEMYLVLDSLHFIAQNQRLVSFIIKLENLKNRDVRHSEFDSFKAHLTSETGRRVSKLSKLNYLQEWLDVVSSYCKTANEVVIEGRKSLAFELLTHIENLKQVVMLNSKVEHQQEKFRDLRLTTIEACEYLSVSRATFYRWKKEHNFKFVTVGNQKTYFQDELDIYKLKGK